MQRHAICFIQKTEGSEYVDVILKTDVSLMNELHPSFIMTIANYIQRRSDQVPTDWHLP